MPYEVQQPIRETCGDREVRFRGRVVGVELLVPCPVRLDPVAAAAAVRTVRATPRLLEEMTRYIASLDEKLDQLEPGAVDFSKLLRSELAPQAGAKSP